MITAYEMIKEALTEAQIAEMNAFPFSETRGAPAGKAPPKPVMGAPPSTVAKPPPGRLAQLGEKGRLGLWSAGVAAKALPWWAKALAAGTAGAGALTGAYHLGKQSSYREQGYKDMLNRVGYTIDRSKL